MSSFLKFQKMLDFKSKIKSLLFKKELEKQASENNLNLSELLTKNNSNILCVLTELLDNLKNEISDSDPDKQIKIMEWINSWIYYLSYEDSFNPCKLRTYQRGDIVHVNFGFNIHNELGGTHYAIVVENNNGCSSGSIVVVPLRSEVSEESAKNNVNTKTEVFLGKGLIPIGKGKDKYTVAKVNQIRAIDKMRIFKPTNDKKDTVYPVDKNVRNDALNKIDAKIGELFTKEKKNIDTSI